MVNDKGKILASREAVDAYREAHRQLHSKPWHRSIPEEHTPLLDKMLAEFRKQGFNSIQEFFNASDELNVKELGFIDRENFNTRATETDREALRLKWK